MADRDRTCENCMYWDRLVGAQKYSGWCRKRPPTVAPGDADDSAWGWWPLTGDCDWCGEHRLLPPTAKGSSKP